MFFSISMLYQFDFRTGMVTDQTIPPRPSPNHPPKLSPPPPSVGTGSWPGGWRRASVPGLAACQLLQAKAYAFEKRSTVAEGGGRRGGEEEEGGMDRGRKGRREERREGWKDGGREEEGRFLLGGGVVESGAWTMSSGTRRPGPKTLLHDAANELQNRRPFGPLG